MSGTSATDLKQTPARIRPPVQYTLDADPVWWHAAPDDLRACRMLLKAGSLTFHAASLVLPSSIRQSATALYAFCRLADDAVDGVQNAREALAPLRARVLAAYESAPMDSPVDRAFADVVTAYAIPSALPLALLEGFEWDATGRRYQTLADVEDYAARVAGSVGAMMALLMGTRDPTMLARACDLGVAMQLTNIARDVGEDARNGRLYLPLEWLGEAGIDPEAFLARPVYSPALGTVIERLLVAADALYARALEGVLRLPLACRPGMEAARVLYAEIGAELRRLGHDSVSQRAVVSAARKSALLTRAVATALDPPRSDLALYEAPPLAATRYLVEAIHRSPLPPGEAIPATYAERIVWMFGLFARLERREQTLRANGRA
jgi:phytoene synthase